ncbi:hypothetical protein D6792_02405 [Candidatus Parcubacteria bacterium]|nr:MAG: hypothetical protein D6792_02405 [Candidatus Parcubacteria bacterium]
MRAPTGIRNPPPAKPPSEARRGRGAGSRVLSRSERKARSEDLELVTEPCRAANVREDAKRPSEYICVAVFYPKSAKVLLIVGGM